MNREASRRLIDTLTDALLRPLTPQEYVDAVELISRIREEGRRRAERQPVEEAA